MEIPLRTAYGQNGRCGMQPKPSSLRAQAHQSKSRTETCELVKVKPKLLDIREREAAKENARGENNSTQQQERTTQPGSRNETTQLGSRNETTQLGSMNETTQLCTALSSTACNRLQPPTTSYNLLQPPTTAYNHLQPPTTACNRLQPPTIACNRLQPPTTTCNRLHRLHRLYSRIGFFYLLGTVDAQYVPPCLFQCNVNAHTYREDILDAYECPYAGAIDDAFVQQDDNTR
ncbi:hypothetical protein TNCV_1311 [Trichonephila clavipes]|nr:hypothetical protein TNCV_1311 [Trichonephila clavipes]